MRGFALMLAALCATCAGAHTNEVFTAPISSQFVLGLDGTRYEVVDGRLVEHSPRPMLLSASMDFPSGAAISADGIYVQNGYTNVNGVAYNRVMLDFSCSFDWRGWHPFIQQVGAGGARTRLEWQEDSVCLGEESRPAVDSFAAQGRYAYGWHGYVIGYAPPSVSMFAVSVDTEPYDGPDAGGDEYYIVTPEGERVPALMQYVMVDQHGNISPSNAVASIEQAAATASRLAAAEVAAVAYTNAADQTEAAVDDLVAAIVDRGVVVYEDDFMYSLGDAVAISTNCQCRVYRFDAKVSQVTVGGAPCDRSWVYFGFTENIGSLSPVAQFKDSLSSDADWGEVTCGTPEPQNHSFEANGDTYEYCYKMSVDIPRTYSSAFFRVYTEITAQVGDGSVLDIVGGVSGGQTMDVRCGSNTLHFVGGLLMGVE